MNLQENIKLADLTTFGTGGEARYFMIATTEDDLVEALKFANERDLAVFILGEGSNTVFADSDFDGLVIQMSLKGIDFVDANQNMVLVRAAAGEVWDDVVAFAVENGFWGIENLSAIPGSAGAFAVQNVEAYGQGAYQVVYSVRVFDRQSNKMFTLDAEKCQFKYRYSIFNSSEKGRYIILETTLRLYRDTRPIIEYPDVIAYFAEKNSTKPTLVEIREAIVTIRANKFTKSFEGKAGSFFKNLYLSPEEYQKMKGIFSEKKPDFVEELEIIKNKFVSIDDKIKIPTAWIIDKVLNLKGTRIGGAQISETQALAIINPEMRATSEDVRQLIDFVIDSVYECTGQKLEVEPELVGFDKK